MAFPMSTKTVFLLDHTHWMRDSNGVQIEIDTGNGGPSTSAGRGSSARGAGLNYFNTSFIPPVSKSLWTCGVETVLEYSRVIFDLFANERLLRVALCQDQQGLVWLNNWEQNDAGVQQQSINYLSEKFANAGPPKDSYKTSPVSNTAAMQIGIQAAIEALSQPTPAQFAFMNGQGGYNKTNLKAINKGRVVCITSCTAQSQSVGKASPDSLIDLFDNVLAQHNRMVAPASDHLLPILECEFVMISIHPCGKAKYSVIAPRPLFEVSPILNCQVVVTEADKLCPTLMDLCVIHHDLVSTTVTGIPMKEEQNSNSSSNYDVPLWHARLSTSHADCSVLKWSSPSAPKTGVGAGAGGLVHHCTSACRITPVDVNSRPSTCLSSFLINGRSVWLETLKKGKSISHMLTSHGGEMWMHVIETARNVLEDPPSISEGLGGRVTDYRIPDFADFMKMNMLIPYPKNYQEHIMRSKPKDARDKDGAKPFIRRRSSSLEDLKRPLDMAKDRLHRKTNYWPMTIGGSLLFPISVHVESLLRLMPQDTINDMEKVECEKSFWTLMSVEARGEPAIASGHHKKAKRDEQWRAVYAELETFIRANQHSENHTKVLECFLESRKVDSKIDSRTNDDRSNRIKDEKTLADLALALSGDPMMTDSPMSPPPANNGNDIKPVVPEATLPLSNKRTLLDLWTAKTEKKDFRVLTNTKLYSHLSSSNTNPDSERKPDVIKS